MKKMLSILLALAMILGLATTAFAANVTINGDDDRDYEGYMLLTASVSGTNFAYEVNAKYSAVLMDVLNLADTATEDDIITEIGKLTDSEAMRHFADDLYKAILAAGLTADVTEWDGSSKALAQGYWLIADVTDLDGKEGVSNSLVMIDTVGDQNITVDTKPDTPESYKKVDDENDSVIDPVVGNEDAINLQDSADYDIGDSVRYSIKTTLPNNVSEYAYYAILLSDTVEEGLTYTEMEWWEILVNGQRKTLAAVGSTDAATADFLYEIVTNTDEDGNQVSQELYVYPNHGYTKVEKDELGNSVQVAASKTAGGDFLGLFAENTAHSTINNSTITFNYFCQLNEAAVVGEPGNPNYYELVFSNDPYSDSFGKTPKDVCVVFTYAASFDKVDGNGNPLTGADFDLFKFHAVAGKDAYTEETAAENGYEYHEGANAWGYWVDKHGARTVNEAGTVFTFTGLDDGWYKLVEKIVPDGYNGIDPIHFHITAEHDTDFNEFLQTGILTALNAKTMTEGQISLQTNIPNGVVTAKVENKSGTELPTTGGMGTTLFYTLGTLLVVSAAVVIVTKKRMTAAE